MRPLLLLGLSHYRWVVSEVSPLRRSPPRVYPGVPVPSFSLSLSLLLAY